MQPDLTVKEVASIFQCSRWAVDRLIQSGELRAYPLRMGKRIRYRITREAVDEFRARCLQSKPSTSIRKPLVVHSSRLSQWRAKRG